MNETHAPPSQTISFTVTSSLQRLMLEKALVMAQELEAATAAAPWGQVARLAEAEAVAKGRTFTALALEQVLQQAIAEREKKTSFAPAPAASAVAAKGRTNAGT
jgi:hypothetical protein